MYSLILASASPRRRDILGSLGLRFEVRPASIDEAPRPGEAPAALAERLAREKALRAAREEASAGAGATGEEAATALPSPVPRRNLPAPLLLAADTVVAIDGEALGKPIDADDAARMLRLLQGRTHDVLTGIALLAPDEGRLESGVGRTRVTFAAMSAAQIAEAVAATSPLDKAGAYGIQDAGTWFVSGVEGSVSNVVGLPTELLAALLARFGVTLDDLR